MLDVLASLGIYIVAVTAVRALIATYFRNYAYARCLLFGHQEQLVSSRGYMCYGCSRCKQIRLRVDEAAHDIESFKWKVGSLDDLQGPER